MLIFEHVALVFFHLLLLVINAYGPTAFCEIKIIYIYNKVNNLSGLDTKILKFKMLPKTTCPLKETLAISFVQASKWLCKVANNTRPSAKKRADYNQNMLLLGIIQ